MHRREDVVVSSQDESGSRNRGTAVEQRMGKTRTVADDDKILINRDLVLLIRAAHWLPRSWGVGSVLPP